MRVSSFQIFGYFKILSHGHFTRATLHKSCERIIGLYILFKYVPEISLTVIYLYLVQICTLYTGYTQVNVKPKVFSRQLSFLVSRNGPNVWSMRCE